MNTPEQYNRLMPYVIVQTADDFINFTNAVFNATVQLIVPGDDRPVMHGELRIGEAVIMFTDASEKYQQFPCSMCLLVENADEIYQKAIAAGAVSTNEPADQDYGRGAGFKDMFGNQWWIIEGIK